VIVTIDITFKY